MRSLFGYLENFRSREFRSLVSYKFPKRNSVDLLRITSREEKKKSFVNLPRARQTFVPSLPLPRGQGRGRLKESGLSSGEKFSRVWGVGRYISFRSNRSYEPRESIGPVILHRFHLPPRRGFDHLSNAHSTLISYLSLSLPAGESLEFMMRENLPGLQINRWASEILSPFAFENSTLYVCEAKELCDYEIMFENIRTLASINQI